MKRNNFQKGDLVRLKRSSDQPEKSVGILIEYSEVVYERFWYVFHTETNTTFRVFENYLEKVEIDSE